MELTLKNSHPVSIETGKKKLTDGELALLALMKKCIEQDSIITYKDVISIYKRQVRTIKGENGEWMGSTCDNRAKRWFVYALGNLILKAKLVAIPVIDID